MDANTTTSIRPGYAQPALIGGLVMGVLSALPLISALNVCCCLWVVSGGVVAAYLFQQNQAAAMSAGDGALVGFLAGIVGAVVLSVLSIPIGLVMAPMVRAMAERALAGPGNMPPELRRMIKAYSQSQTGVTLLTRAVVRVLTFGVTLVALSVVSTIGGLLGAALFAKRQPPAAPAV